MIYNIDFDGVIIPEDFEKKFFNVDKSWRVSIDDYIRMVVESPLPPLNHNLLAYLHGLTQSGNVVRLLTNRNKDLAKHTINTLDGYASIFDSFTFCDGMKKNYRVEGIMIDNEKKYLSCGLQGGIHYVWNGKEVK
jgi:hypothetical protein